MGVTCASRAIWLAAGYGGLALVGTPSVPRFTSFSTTTRNVRVDVGSPDPTLQVISPMRVISDNSVSPPTPIAELSSVVLKFAAQA